MNAKVNRSGQGLRPWHVALGIVGLLIVAIALWAVFLSSSTKRKLAALRADGYPTSFAELAEYNRLPDGVRNAADIYVMAFDAFFKPDRDATIPYVGKTTLPEKGAPLPEAIALATEQFLANNQECLDLLREAATIEHCRYDWDYAQDMPYLSSIRCCARLLASAVILRGYQGDGMGSLAHFKDGLYLAGSLEKEPTLVSHLVRIACTALSITALEQILSVAVFTDEQLAEVGEMLTETAARLDFSEVWISERCSMIEYIRDPSLVDGGGARILELPGIGALGLADMLDYMGNCVEASAFSPEKRVARFRELHDKLESLSILHIGAKFLSPALARIAELDLRCKTSLDMALTAVGIERYRLATGTLPEDLEALVPDYLDQVPIDPFDGQPIRYRRTDPGYRLYSVSEDGQDHGGLGREEVARREPHDWPFIVVRRVR